MPTRLICLLVASSMFATPSSAWALRVAGPAEEPAPAPAPPADPTAAPPSDPSATDDATPTPDPPPAEPPPAEPSDRDKAAALYREGTQAYDLQQYDKAIVKFEQAWKLAPEPALLFNLGQAHWHWFDVDPNIEHLRKARRYFEDYDQRMQGREDYFPNEVKAFLTALDTQIEAEEIKAAERNRPVIQGPSVDDLEAAEQRRLKRERRLAMAKRFNVTGVAFIVAGSVAAAIGVAGLIVRGANGVIIDSTAGEPGSPNAVSAEDDERRRDAYLVGGQMAFGSFIAAGVLLPIGIGFRVGGAVIERQELGKRDKQRKLEAAPKPTPAPTSSRPRNVQVYASPGSLLRIEF